MFVIRKYVLGLILFCSLVADVYADTTSQSGNEISNIRFDGTGKNLYLETTDGQWISGSCQSTYIWVKPSVEGQKEILSIALAAKMANKKVWFQGACSSTNTGYFEATYIILK